MAQIRVLGSDPLNTKWLIDTSHQGIKEEAPQTLKTLVLLDFLTSAHVCGSLLSSCNSLPFFLNSPLSSVAFKPNEAGLWSVTGQLRRRVLSSWHDQAPCHKIMSWAWEWHPANYFSRNNGMSGPETEACCFQLIRQEWICTCLCIESGH